MRCLIKPIQEEAAMPEKTDSVTACHCSSTDDESAPAYTVEKRDGVLNVTVTSGKNKGQKSVFFEMPPSLAYFNAKK